MIDKYNEIGIEPTILEHIETANMCMTGNATAQPMRECLYPKCEECDKYHGHYCTVPIVVSKQIYRQTEARLQKMEYDIAELKELVTDEILRSKVRFVHSSASIADPENLTWADILGEDE